MKQKKVSVSARKRRLIIGSFAAAIVFILCSCNVVRTMTTESSSVQRGDTCILIQTKTIESYTASKK